MDTIKLKSLLDKVDFASNRIFQKDVVLLLGNTGAGKSTFIHYLSGSKMKRELVKGIEHIGPSEIVNEQAKDILTGPFAFSVTKYIHAVDIKEKSVELTLCDTPGFEDN